MSHRAGGLAWALWALFVALAAGLALLSALNGTSPIAGQVLAALAIASFPTIGAIVAARRPRNPMGWIILVIALSFVASQVAYQYALYTLVTAPGSLPAGAAAAWLSTWVGLPGTILLLTFFLLLFPTGRVPSTGWRPIAYVAAALLVLAPAADALTPGNASWADSPVINPLGIDRAGALLQWLNGFFRLAGNLLGVLCGASLVIRFRRARSDERQQLKWFGSAALVVVFFFVVNLIAKVVPSTKPDLPDAAVDVIFGLVISLPAVAIGIAILKYRLYDIDIIIRRTLIYAVLSALLLLVYFGSVLLLEQLLGTLTGQRQSELVTVLATLAIAALFVPLRNRIQSAIDRRFYRRKYDAARVLENFSARVRDEVDLTRLREHLVGAVNETMRPAHVSLWLRQTAEQRVETNHARTALED